MAQTLIDLTKLKDRDAATLFDYIGNYLKSGVATKFATATNTSDFTATAAQLTGGSDLVVLQLTGTLGAGANMTTDTAANIIAALTQPVAVGTSYTLRIINSSGGAFSWTVVAGSGVTVTGTATVAQNTWREFQVSVTSATAVTLQSIGTGTMS